MSPRPARPRTSPFAGLALAAGLTVAAGTLGGAAHAQDAAAGWAPSVQAGLASDDLFRGVDQTRGRGEAFASGELDGPSSRLGAFVSNVAAPSPGGAANQAEVDLYGGWLGQAEGFDLELGAVGYLFTGAHGRPDLGELYGRLGRTLGPARLGLAAYVGAGTHGAGDGYAELNADYPLTPKWSLTAAVGHLYESRPGVLDAFAVAASDRGGFNATVFKAGVSYALSERIGLDLVWSDADRTGPAYPSRVFATVRAKLF